MNRKKWLVALFVSLFCWASSNTFQTASGQSGVGQQVEFISPQDLKAKILSNERVTVIDVRSASGLAVDGNKIKGSIYVKLRRLKSRLAFPPLKDVSRNQEVITYCACPNDESSVRAAQILIESGFTRVRVLKGGWSGWQKVKGQVDSLARGM